nr:hypothetical protein Itr_chr03CG09750 [Ipomoea trifida]
MAAENGKAFSIRSTRGFGEISSSTGSSLLRSKEGGRLDSSQPPSLLPALIIDGGFERC